MRKASKRPCCFLTASCKYVRAFQELEKQFQVNFAPKSVLELLKTYIFFFSGRQNTPQNDAYVHQLLIKISSPSTQGRVLWEFIPRTLLSFLCTIARRNKCRTNKNQSLPIDMHWMFPHCSDRDASPNSGLEITGQRRLCLPEWRTAGGTRGGLWSETWQVLFLASLLQEETA